MLLIYNGLMCLGTPLLHRALKKRCRAGKEDEKRLGERMGRASQPRPEGKLVWFHAASVGEAQSMLILLNRIRETYPAANILVTTGTVTSAELMEKRLPGGTIHQYYPLDHPGWVKRFLNHWRPDLVIWMESEIWPMMLRAIKKRNIPAALVNARLSPKSFKRWKLAKREMKKLLTAFRVCLAQTEEDTEFYRQLGFDNAETGGNLKYSAKKLPYDEKDLERLQGAIKIRGDDERPVWLYASTHDGEEELAARLHLHLKNKFPGLLTILVPRHPERREKIKTLVERYELKALLRGQSHHLPAPDTDIYIADTLGELGLFYRFSPIACIGRSFSNDGGGGHNPIEAAQLECAILHGPNIQNLAKIYKDMDEAGASLPIKDENDFHNRLEKLLQDSDGLYALQQKAFNFVYEKSRVIDTVTERLGPLLAELEETPGKNAENPFKDKDPQNVRKSA